jgi:hypothetical protein
MESRCPVHRTGNPLTSAAMNLAWESPAGGVYRCRLPFLDVTIGLVAGADHVLLIDCGTTLPEARAIAETLTVRKGVLVAVCGRPAGSADLPPGGDDEECWARQLGAFVYLPGVGSDAGIALLVDEARRIVRGGT